MKLFYREYGRGEPLIILHGLFGMSDNWVSLARRWAEHFHVFVLDFRNHGQSPHSPEFNYSVLADDLYEFMLDRALPSACILGHSLGGKTAMLFALNHPEMTEKMVVVDIAPRAYVHTRFKQFLKLLLNMNLQKVHSRIESDRYLAAKIPQTAIRHFLLKNLRRSTHNSFEWKLNLPALYENVERVLEAIEPDGQTFEGPALFLRGENSDYIGEKDVPRIKALFPQARVVTVPGATHWVHADNPDFLFNQVLWFLEDDSGIAR